MNEPRTRIGDFLLQQGLLTPGGVEETLAHARRTGLRFGEAAIDCGLIQEHKLRELFGPLYWVDYFHLDPAYFPRETKDWVPVEFLVEHGILLLGTKAEGGLFFRARKWVNVGFLHPVEGQIEAVSALLLEQLKSHGVTDVRPLLVLPDPFIQIFEAVYQITPDKLRASGGERRIDETLSLFLER